MAELTWERLKGVTKINVLSGESTVEPDLLCECELLIEAIKQGKSKEECLQIINENF
jgi:hypothetical protein